MPTHNRTPARQGPPQHEHAEALQALVEAHQLSTVADRTANDATMALQALMEAMPDAGKYADLAMEVANKIYGAQNALVVSRQKIVAAIQLIESADKESLPF